MKNFLHRKIWCTGEEQIHVELPPIILIKRKNDTKAGKLV